MEELGERCRQLEPLLTPIVDEAVPLTQYAWKYRYPGDLSEPSREEAEAALALAHAVYTAVLARLPDEIQKAAMPKRNLELS